MSATRLPGKPLLKISGLSIISHVCKKAEDANIGEVIVAAEDREIVEEVNKNGFRAILTSKTHKTGTDRIYEALEKSNIKNIEFIMNLQGDEPAINVEDIINLNKKMLNKNLNLGTLAAKLKNGNDLKNENLVKVVTDESLNKDNFPKALSFSRKSENVQNVYHHIGIYCYSKVTLEKFVKLSQSKNEIQNKLEQLRALDNDIQINVSLAKGSPIGIDTEEDYLALKKIMEYNKR
tara:strand:- start:51 stop:755 length:705 start_codon:yes stop_codon:yes gene_type:complete